MQSTKPIYPRLGQNEKVFIKGRPYRVEVWNTPKGIEYELWDDSQNIYFTRTAEQVADAIRDKKIKRT